MSEEDSEPQSAVDIAQAIRLRVLISIIGVTTAGAMFYLFRAGALPEPHSTELSPARIFAFAIAFFVALGPALVLEVLSIQRLRERHAAAWRELGEPREDTFVRNPTERVRLLKYFLSMRVHELRDNLLSTYGFLLKVLVVAIGIGALSVFVM